MPNTATKTARTLQPSATNSAGGTTSGAAVDLTTALGMVVTAQVSNGATGPDAPCAFILEVSHDPAAGAWRELSRQSAGVGANEEAQFVVEVPAAVMHVRSRFTGNTGQDVTVEAVGHELTGIG